MIPTSVMMLEATFKMVALLMLSHWLIAKILMC